MSWAKYVPKEIFLLNEAKTLWTTKNMLMEVQ